MFFSRVKYRQTRKMMTHVFAPLAVIGNAVCFYIGGGGALGGIIFFVTIVSLPFFCLVTGLRSFRPRKKCVKIIKCMNLVLPIALADIGLLIYLYEGTEDLLNFTILVASIVMGGLIIWLSFDKYRVQVVYKKPPSRAKINILSVLIPVGYFLMLLCLGRLLPVELLGAVFVVTYAAFAAVSTPMAVFFCKYNKGVR